MDAVLDKPPVLRPPKEALRRLVRVSPSDRALAEILGTDNHSVAAWRNGVRRMRRPYLDVIPRMDALVDCLVAAGVDDADITYLLQSEWPPLDSKQPAVALKEGDLIAVLRAVPVMVGKEDALPQLPDDEQQLVDWLAEVISREPEMAAAVVDDDAHETVDPVEWLSEAWRGGATMSSERWSRRR